jgi:hypothetical protein
MYVQAYNTWPVILALWFTKAEWKNKNTVPPALKSFSVIPDHLAKHGAHF